MSDKTMAPLKLLTQSYITTPFTNQCLKNQSVLNTKLAIVSWTI